MWGDLKYTVADIIFCGGNLGGKRFGGREGGGAKAEKFHYI